VTRILRNMARRKVRTGLTIFGIAIGVFALTVMGALSEYFALQLNQAESLYSHIIGITPAKTGLNAHLTTSMVAQIRQVNGVLYVENIIATTLNDTRQSAISLGPPETVIGVDPAAVKYVFGSIPLRAGRWIDPTDSRATVVGFSVAQKHHLGIGSALAWQKHDYTVVGILSDTNGFPDQYAIIPLDVVQRDAKMPRSAIGQLDVVTQPNADPEVVSRQIEREVPQVKARSPRQEAADAAQQMAVFNAIVLGGALLAAVVGGLAVVNTMIMSVNERTREIGIKKALGAEDRTIVREYLSEAALIGLLGGVAGLWAGWVVASLLNATVAAGLGGSDVWRVTPRLVVLVLSFAMGLGLVAGVYPAWSAARLDPVQALRSE